MKLPAARVRALLLALTLSALAPPARALNVSVVGHIALNPGCGGYSDALFVHDDRAYVMEYRGTTSNPCANYQAWLEIIDTSNPAAPVRISEWRLPDAYPGDMHGVYYSNGYLYCACQRPTQGVAIYDARDPLAVAQVAFLPVTSGAHVLRLAEDRLYVTPNSDPNAHIRVFDVADPTNPVPLGNFFVRAGGYCHDVSVFEHIGYASCWNDGPYLIDFTNPAAPRVIGSYGSASIPSIHSAWPTPDRRTLVTCQEIDDQGLRTYDITTGNPAPIGQYNLGHPSIAHDVMVVGRYAYMTYYGDGFKVLDLAVPASPTVVGTYATGTSCNGGYCSAIAQWVEDGLVYVTDMQTGLWILSFDLPHEAPLTLLAVKTPDARDVAMRWNFNGESQYTLRDGLVKSAVGTRLVDIDGALHHTEANVVQDGRTHFYKLNGPWR